MEVYIMCNESANLTEAEDLLKRLIATRPRVLDDEILEYAETLKCDPEEARLFLMRAGIHDEDGHLINRVV